MPTITVRNISHRVVRFLKALAKWRNRPRRAILGEIEASWQQQARRPTADEVDEWVGVGRQ